MKRLLLLPLLLAGCTALSVQPGGVPDTGKRVLAKAPAADCAALFKQLDANGNGKLTRAEYGDGMLAIHEYGDPNWRRAPVTSCGASDYEARYAAGFDLVDVDRDGAATKGEFVGYCEGTDGGSPGVPRPYLKPAECDQRVAEADEDGDGLLTAAEFREAWPGPTAQGPLGPAGGVKRYALQCSLAAPNYAGLFARTDADMDGKVSGEELCGVLTGAEPLPATAPTPDNSPWRTTPEPTTSPTADPNATPVPGQG